MASEGNTAPASRGQVERADLGAILALVVSVITAWFAWGTLNTDRQALHANAQAAIDTERTTLFLQFEQQYYTIAARLPKQLHHSHFQPGPQTDDYARLQAYWTFCFSEWYATQRVNRPAFADLWVKYYEPLVASGLKIPSLRYVLERGIREHGVGSGDWTAFLRELARIASAHGEPLDSDVQASVNGNQVAQIGATDLRLASQRIHPKR